MVVRLVYFIFCQNGIASTFQYLGELYMNPKRKKVQDYILSVIKQMDDVNGKNIAYYNDLFKKLSDKDFDDYMKRIRDKQDTLVFYAANMDAKLKVKDLVKTAKSIGLELFERIRMYDPVTDSYYLTPYKQMVVQCPVRKMIQFVDHKLSVAEGDSRIDSLSGQVCKPDQAASISQVEVQTLYARGLTKTIRELTKFRGGDVSAFGEFKRELEEQGSTSIGADTNSIPRSAVTLDTLYSGMLIESNASGL